MKTYSVTEFRDTSCHRLCINRFTATILLLPFFLYAALCTSLPSVRYPDSSSYFWAVNWNVHFLQPRSLIQRLLFNAAGKNDLLIAWLHLAFFAAWAIALYLSCKTANRPLNLVKALTISLLFSSYTFAFGGLSMTPEPFHLAMMSMAFVVFFSSAGKRPARFWLVGWCMLLSKNTAPFMMLGMVSLLIGAKAFKTQGIIGYRHLVLMAVTSIALILYTQRFDTSLQLNLANNYFARIFVDPQLTETFHDRDGLPRGAYVKRARGQFIHVSIDGTHPAYSLNSLTQCPELRDDPFGFKIWLIHFGKKALYRYWFIERPLDTWDDLAKGYADLATGPTIAFFSEEISGYMPKRVAYVDRWSERHPHQREGFLGFDPLTRWWSWTVNLGLGSWWGVFLCAAFNLWVFLRTRDLVWLRGFAQFSGSWCLFALNYLGDPMELQRHAAPALILLAFAAFELGWRLVTMALE